MLCNRNVERNKQYVPYVRRIIGIMEGKDMDGTTKVDMEDGTGAYALHCNDCGAHVMNGKAEDIKHHATCTPTPTDDAYFNAPDEEACSLCVRCVRSVDGLVCQIDMRPVTADSDCYHDESRFKAIADSLDTDDGMVKVNCESCGQFLYETHIDSYDPAIDNGANDSHCDGGHVCGVTRILNRHYGRSPNTYKVGTCPSCDGDLYVVAKAKLFGQSCQAVECDKCNYKESR